MVMDGLYLKIKSIIKRKKNYDSQENSFAFIALVQ